MYTSAQVYRESMYDYKLAVDKIDKHIKKMCENGVYATQHELAKLEEAKIMANVFSNIRF